MSFASAASRFLIIAGMVASAGAAQAQYRSMSCGDLWVERNSIYKAGGYCFNTQRGISYFGNAGCQYDNVRDVPLSARDRQRINDIVAAERARGCTG